MDVAEEMDPNKLDDDELLYLVGMTDKALFDSGRDIRQREWEVPQELMKKFGYPAYMINGDARPQILKRIDAAFASIYRKQDLAMGGHIGVYMYRDIFARISVPIMFGQVKLNPFEFVELSETQLRMIQIEPAEIETFLDQFSDVGDIQYGVQELKKPYSDIELVVRFIELSRLHLHSAAAILTGGFDYRGAVQSSILATELALKSGAAAFGLGEDEIKKRFNHRNSEIAEFVADRWTTFDLDRVKRVISKQPPYSQNRYSAQQPNRVEVGHLTMSAQYLVAEVVRQMCDRDFRNDLSPPFQRRYPA